MVFPLLLRVKVEVDLGRGAAEEAPSAKRVCRGMGEVKALQRKMRALGFKGADGFDVGRRESVMAMVAWLEDTKIRFYREDGRAGLRRTGDWEEWWKSFEKYLSDMGCPRGLAGEKGLAEVLDWLLGQAVGFEFREQRRSGGSKQTPQAVSTVDMSALRRTAETLRSRLGGIPPDESLLNMLRAMAHVLENRGNEEWAARAAEGKSMLEKGLRDFPLGLTTGGESGHPSADCDRR